MKVTPRQAKIINEIINEEVQKVVSGRRLIKEEGPNPWRIDHNLVKTAAEAFMYEEGMEIGSQILDKYDTKILRIVVNELNKHGFGGANALALSSDELVDYLENIDVDYFGELQMNFVYGVANLVKEYAGGFAAAAVEIAYDYDED